jgi:cyclic pyranopterin phosphate synthase
MSLVDGIGRTIDYLRISVTDRCNLRCLYCMPNEGVGWIPHDDVLRFEEAMGICRILAGLGIKSVRVTGGEPLLRRGLAGFISGLKALSGVNHLGLTSNGVLLGEQLESLVKTGLDALNITINTMDRGKFARLTRVSDVVNVIPVIDRALEMGLKVKLNTVMIRGFNEDEVAEIAGLAKNRNIAARFIELMPLEEAASFEPFYAHEAAALIEGEYGPLLPVAAKFGNGPAEYYTVDGFAGHIGFISPMSRRFCENCNKLRLTASGFLKLCLSDDAGIDLRGLVRGGASDNEIAGLILEQVALKPAGHCFDKSGGNINMFRIGG